MTANLAPQHAGATPSADRLEASAARTASPVRTPSAARTASPTRTAPRRRLRRTARQRLIIDIVVVALALLWLLPVYWMVKSSLQQPQDLLASPPKMLALPATFDNYLSVLGDPSFWSAMSMSLGAATITVIATSGTALFAALALSRFGFRGRRTLIVMILVVQMIPAEALFISQYRMLDGWALLNSVAGLSLLYVGGVLPFVIWMMRGYVAGIPEELEQAAMVDGCTRTGAFLRVTLPLLAPGLISTGVFAFLHSWNEYTLALIVLSRDTAVTLPIWLQSFQQGLRDTDWGGVMAGSTLIALPVMILFAVVQGRMGQGMVSGAVKG